MSGGHLCAQHRSTDRGGSRDLEPTTFGLSFKIDALKSLLRCTKVAFRLERRQLSTAALRFARCISHCERSQPHPTSNARRPHNPKPKIRNLISITRKISDILKDIRDFLVAGEGLEPTTFGL